jgi:hypothetical protein
VAAHARSARYSSSAVRRAPIQFFALRRGVTPCSGKLEIESAGFMGSASRTTYRDALRSPVFAGLAIWFTGHGGSYSGFIFQLLPMLALWHVDTAAVLLTVTLIGPMQVLGRIALAAIGKSASVRVIGIGVMLALASSTLALMLLPRTGAALVLLAAARHFGGRGARSGTIRRMARASCGLDSRRECRGSLRGCRASGYAATFDSHADSQADEPSRTGRTVHHSMKGVLDIWPKAPYYGLA